MNLYSLFLFYSPTQILLLHWVKYNKCDNTTIYHKNPFGLFLYQVLLLNVYLKV